MGSLSIPGKRSLFTSDCTTFSGSGSEFEPVKWKRMKRGRKRQRGDAPSISAESSMNVDAPFTSNGSILIDVLPTPPQLTAHQQPARRLPPASLNKKRRHHQLSYGRNPTGLHYNTNSKPPALPCRRPSRLRMPFGCNLNPSKISDP